MNESKFENELRALRPTAPSARLVDRVSWALPTGKGSVSVFASGVMDRPRPLLGWLRNLAWAGAGAAAALSISAWMRPAARQPEPTTGPSSFTMAASTRELLNLKDEGIQVSATVAPQRQVRVSYLEREMYTNPETGGVIAYETPREGVVIMPVAFQ